VSEVHESPDDALVFAERFLELLDSTRYSATYKLAALLALIDVAAGTQTSTGEASCVLSGREIGLRVLEFYWPHSEPFIASSVAAQGVLRQSAQNDIPSKLAAFRSAHELQLGASVADAQRADPEVWNALEREVIRTVIRMPLAKLQRFTEGTTTTEDRFIYDFSWPDEVANSVIEADGFDDRIVLRPRVGEWLVRLAPLLRPAIQTKWADLVARRNTDLVDQRQLNEFLFGAQRINLTPIRQSLIDLQAGCCFYCGGSLQNTAQVDHFLPWSRHPLNLLDNLVVADARCNAKKSASLAALDHLEAWVARSEPQSPASEMLETIATEVSWPRNGNRTRSVARALYLWLPETARLWHHSDAFEQFDRDRCRVLLEADRSAA
jgi:5-methylcytosine-specific restriction endonuclease McrA